MIKNPLKRQRYDNVTIEDTLFEELELMTQIVSRLETFAYQNITESYNELYEILSCRHIEGWMIFNPNLKLELSARYLALANSLSCHTDPRFKFIVLILLSKIIKLEPNSGLNFTAIEQIINILEVMQFKSDRLLPIEVQESLDYLINIYFEQENLNVVFRYIDFCKKNKLCIKSPLFISLSSYKEELEKGELTLHFLEEYPNLPIQILKYCEDNGLSLKSLDLSNMDCDYLERICYHTKTQALLTLSQVKRLIFPVYLKSGLIHLPIYNLHSLVNLTLLMYCRLSDTSLSQLKHIVLSHSNLTKVHFIDLKKNKSLEIPSDLDEGLEHNKSNYLETLRIWIKSTASSQNPILSLTTILDQIEHSALNQELVIKEFLLRNYLAPHLQFSQLTPYSIILEYLYENVKSLIPPATIEPDCPFAFISPLFFSKPFEMPQLPCCGNEEALPKEKSSSEVVIPNDYASSYLEFSDSEESQNGSGTKNNLFNMISLSPLRSRSN